MSVRESENSNRPTAREVWLTYLAAPGDPAVDSMAELALDAIEERDALQEALSVALEQLHQVHAQLQRARCRPPARADRARPAA